jgi:hypothetical protein
MIFFWVYMLFSSSRIVSILHRLVVHRSLHLPWPLLLLYIYASAAAWFSEEIDYTSTLIFIRVPLFGGTCLAEEGCLELGHNINTKYYYSLGNVHTLGKQCAHFRQTRKKRNRTNPVRTNKKHHICGAVDDKWTVQTHNRHFKSNK